MEQALHRRHARMHFGWKQIAVWIGLLLVIALLGARLYLPIWLKDYVNTHLNSMKGYRGGVQDIDVHLYRGAYVIKGLKLNKIDKGIPVPFLTIATSDISLQWGALFNGRIASDIHLTQPHINFAVSKSGTSSQTGTETNWNPLINSLVPIDINYIELNNGKISYRDFSATPQVNIYVTNLNGKLTNLRNVVDKHSALPSDIHVTGNSIGKGKLAIDGRLNTLTKRWIDMDIDTKLEATQLPAFNTYTDACCALNFKKGRMDLYSELAVDNGNLNGYLKILVHDLSVDRVTEHSNPLEVLWANVAAVLLDIFKNQPKDQFATKIPLAGNLDDIHTEFWPAVGAIFRNAFVKAFTKGTDNDVSFKPLKKAEKKDTEKPEASKTLGVTREHPLRR